MTKPSFDDIELDAGFQKVHGQGMAQTMSRELFGSQAFASRSGQTEIFFDDAPYAEPCKTISPLADEKEVLSRQSGLPPIGLQIGLDRFDSGHPQGEGAILVALARNGDHFFGEIEPANPGVGHFLAPSAGIVEIKQESSVSEPVRGAGIDAGKENLQLLVREVIPLDFSGFFHGNRRNFAGLAFEAWPLPGCILEEGFNGGQSVIACRSGISAALRRILQIFKEIEDERDVDIRQTEMRRALFSASEFQQELEAVSIALDSVRADLPLLQQVGAEESLQVCLEISGFHLSLRRDEARLAGGSPNAL